ncbi:uncharacterized protein LOC100908153 [Galendromus occidentalis]|uniref:Uncharacterized protein LOC100908153 n=1 Tax=Galendromus occidentalis TaxID=34638 RepID=A0AAJ6VVP1_9ACAR|nr:uncharacterized protein LOC100908153 [Galendromus occidentalis]
MRQARKLNEELREQRKREGLDRFIDSRFARRDSIGRSTKLRSQSRKDVTSTSPQRARGKTGFSWKFDYDLTLIKNIMPKGSAGKVKALVDLFNSRTSDRERTGVKEIVLKRSRSHVSITSPRLTSTTNEDLSPRIDREPNRIRKVCFSSTDLFRYERETDSSTEESGGSSYEDSEGTDDGGPPQANPSCQPGLAIPDIKSLISRFEVDPAAGGSYQTSAIARAVFLI